MNMLLILTIVLLSILLLIIIKRLKIILVENRENCHKEKISLLIGALTLATVALVLVAKNTKWADVVQGIMMLGAVVAFALGTLIVFRK